MAQHPHIHLLTNHESDREAFKSALDAYPLPPSYTLSYHDGSLSALEPSVKFDMVVSPANSHGLMDGGFDDALSRAFSPRGDYYTLTRTVQKRLYQEWKGFAPPGTCTLVPFDYTSGKEADATSSAGSSGTRHGCRIIAVCPTMRTPQVVKWDREVIFECVWSMLCAVDRWNNSCTEEERIKSLLMTPLATGVGRVSALKWATQTLLALRRFDEASSEQAKWGALDWEAVTDLDNELMATHVM